MGGEEGVEEIKGSLKIILKYFKSMQATIDTMFVTEKIIRIYSFCPFSP